MGLRRGREAKANDAPPINSACWCNPPWTECEYSERRYFCNALAMNGAEHRRYYCNTLPASHTLVSLHPWPCVTFTLLVVVSTSQLGVFVMTAYRALIMPSEEDAVGRRCILDSHPGRRMPAAVRMPAIVRMPACHSRRFKGERPIGAATG